MKKLLVVGLIVSLLMVGVVAPASADWTDVKEVSVTGNTGSVKISCTPVKVTLPGWIYPGYTGNFTVTVTNGQKLGVNLAVAHFQLPGYLTVTGPFGTFSLIPGQVATFNFTVSMPDSETGYQNKAVSFIIKFTATNL